jgi:hypothetical protein
MVIGLRALGDLSVDRQERVTWFDDEMEGLTSTAR